MPEILWLIAWSALLARLCWAGGFNSGVVKGYGQGRIETGDEVREEIARIKASHD